MTYTITDQTREQLHSIRDQLIGQMFNITATLDGGSTFTMHHRELTESERNNPKLLALLNDRLERGRATLQREFDNAPTIEQIRRIA